MARDAMTKPAITASVSSYKSLRKTTQKPIGKIICNMCSKSTENLFGAVKIKMT